VSAGEYSLYIVRWGDGTLYTGIAVDVDRRLQAHAGQRGARYLRGRGPLQLVFAESIGDRAAASRVEHRVKRLDRQQKEALIAGRIALAELLDTAAA
jgi:putative endonuclease